MTTPADPEKTSTLRMIAGSVCLAASLIVILASFVMMVVALERTGYGSSGVTYALVWMSGGGALLGVGMSLLIWELSVRYNIRH